MGSLFHRKKRTSKDGGHYFIHEKRKKATSKDGGHDFTRKKERLKTAVIISHEKENV